MLSKSEREHMLKHRKKSENTKYASYTICLQIASYCDKELMNTVFSAMIQADYPERVHFAICYQEDDMTDYYRLKAIKNCKVKYLSIKESHGSCFARYECQKLVDDEDFVMHTDSHMRFIKHWDTLIIKQWIDLDDEKAIISAYPPNCNTGDMMTCKLDDPRFDKPADGRHMYANCFRDYLYPTIQFNVHPINNEHPLANKRNAFVSAGYFFGPAQADRDVMVDPDMYFFGDELPIAVRLFTYGYNVYNPGESYAYHEYMRKNRKFPNRPDCSDIEKIRMGTLYKTLPEKDWVDLGEFGLGSERTLEEFCEFTGINFKDKLMAESAVRGDFSDEYRNMYSNDQLIFSENYLDASRGKINILIVTRKCDNDKFAVFVDQVRNTMFYPERVQFHVITTDKKFCKSAKRKFAKVAKFYQMSGNPNYGELLKNLISKVPDNEYVMLCDYTMRFCKNWDMHYIQCLTSMGVDDIITSRCYTTDTGRYVPHNNSDYEIKKIVWPYIIPGLSSKQLRNGEYVKTNYLMDMFMFCKCETLKAINFDPALSYKSMLTVFPMLVFTYGRSIYLPTSSYVCRTTDKYDMKDIVLDLDKDRDIVYMAMGSLLESVRYNKYEYGAGKKRSILQWYAETGVNYRDTKYKPVNEKT